ncbi:MAG: hypothetical protein NDI62_03095 [Burkholderiales bacterium]|nr:hypothetical protein [Burkholderiales bacterium]
METKGDKNVLAHIADVILKSKVKDNNQYSGIKYESLPFAKEEAREGLKELARNKYIEIEKDYDTYLHEEPIHDPFPINNHPSKTIYTIPAGALVKIKNEKELKKLASTKSFINPNIKDLKKDESTGDFYLKEDKLEMGHETTHYTLLELFYEKATDGVITQDSALEFFNERKIKVGGKKITKENINKTINNYTASLLRFAKIKGKRFTSSPIKKVKKGKYVIGWKFSK